ncbi:MAG: carboxymuconolactone decarboxylase family protein, partial [Planctomycetota bacterium]
AALGEGELPAKTREQIALTVGQANECEYCLSAHSAIGKMVGLSTEQIRDARMGTAPDAKTEAILWVSSKLVEKRGLLSDDDLAAVRDAGVTDGEIAEVVANTALNLFTNYFNHVAQTEVDFPIAEALETIA